MTEDGNPAVRIANCGVILYTADGTYVGTWRTDENGVYAIRNRPDGDYKVYFSTAAIGTWLS